MISVQFIRTTRVLGENYTVKFAKKHEPERILFEKTINGEAETLEFFADENMPETILEMFKCHTDNELMLKGIKADLEERIPEDRRVNCELTTIIDVQLYLTDDQIH